MAERIGTVVRLQIQRTPLIQSAPSRGDRTYDPAPLLSVERMMVSARGALGWCDGGWMLDVHHADHPQVRGRGLRGLSMGFTSHYHAMTERFGHVPLGVAGENVIAETPRRWTADELEGGVVVRPGGGGDDLVLRPVRPAEPCLEFTSFLLTLPRRAARDDVASELEFSSGGTRGFLVDPGSVRTPQPVAVGDEVWLAS
jgi:hypothetical protein